MLYITQNKMKELSFDRIMPLDNNNLIIVASPEIAFAIKNIRNDVGQEFNIRNIMEDNAKIFGDEDFNERMTKFAEISFSRIERFFITKKSPYIFFDGEEQAFLKDLFQKHALSGIAEILEIEDYQFTTTNLANISITKYTQDIKPALKTLGANVMLSPDVFVHMTGKCRHYDKIVNEKRGKNHREERKVRKILSDYPSLNKIKSKQEFKEFVKSTSKKLHPDVNKDKNTTFEFQVFRESMEIVKKKSYWYKSLPEEA